MTCEICSSPSDTDGGLRLQMHRIRDRYQSHIVLIDGDVSRVLLQSVEGGSSEIWPRSPPLQEALLQSNDAGEYLAGIGGAGSSHWSLIASPLIGQTGFEFDFACRTNQMPTWLGNCYQVLGQEPFSWRHDSDLSRLDIGKGRSIHSLAVSGLRTAGADDHLQLEADLPNEPVFPATLRWKYRLVLES